MITVSATLSNKEHAQLQNDVRHLDWWNDLIQLARVDGQTTITAPNTEAGECLKMSLRDGLLRVWGYHKKFRLPT